MYKVQCRRCHNNICLLRDGKKFFFGCKCFVFDEPLYNVMVEWREGL